MRLIDADALVQTLKKRHERFKELVDEENKVIEAMYQYAVKVINDAPTVEIYDGKDKA